jgi:phage shock protein C
MLIKEKIMEPKRMLRSTTNRMLGGVCAGIAEYYQLDPTLVRVAFVLLALLGGPGILLYLILLLVIPEA